MDIAIVHYNTPEVTEALLRSICRHTPGARVFIFDNSDHRRFNVPDGYACEVIDNTRGRVIDFTAWLARHPYKMPTAAGWGSEKHILSVQWLWDHIGGPFLLLDSDVLLLRDVSPIADGSVAWVGEVERKPRFWFQSQRLIPFCLWINAPMCSAAGVRFARDGYIYKVSHFGAPPFYDTGGSFYRECCEAGLPGREIFVDEWVVHMGSASHHRTQEDADLWLRQHKNLYL